MVVIFIFSSSSEHSINISIRKQICCVCVLTHNQELDPGHGESQIDPHSPTIGPAINLLGLMPPAPVCGMLHSIEQLSKNLSHR